MVCSECTNVHRKILEEGGVLFSPHTDQNTSSLPQTPHSCSFCSKPQDQVQRLIAGAGGFFICGECVDLRMEMLREEMGKGRRSGKGVKDEIMSHAAFRRSINVYEIRHDSELRGEGPQSLTPELSL